MMMWCTGLWCGAYHIVFKNIQLWFQLVLLNAQDQNVLLRCVSEEGLLQECGQVRIIYLYAQGDFYYHVFLSASYLWFKDNNEFGSCCTKHVHLPLIWSQREGNYWTHTSCILSAVLSIIVDLINSHNCRLLGWFGGKANNDILDASQVRWERIMVFDQPWIINMPHTKSVWFRFMFRQIHTYYTYIVQYSLGLTKEIN